MPEICRFWGIIIYMYWDDHAPPHFHAEYGQFKVTIEIKTRISDGRFPPRTLRALIEWAEIHEQELLKNWDLLQAGSKPKKIEPLE